MESTQFSVHRCPLPPPGVEFNSEEGKRIFSEAFQAGYMEGYFELAPHFLTQDNTGFCGIGSLTMALNTLLIDPRRVYSGMFRWYDQEMLDCCVPLEKAKLEGTSISTIACLAQCNGCNVKIFHGAETSEDSFRLAVKNACSLPQGQPKEVLLVSYSREALGQVGIGHFSPIGGYHPGSDMVLIMDVARFKYPPHWLPLRVLFEAMIPIDPDTGKSRGFLMLSAASEPLRCEGRTASPKEDFCKCYNQQSHVKA